MRIINSIIIGLLAVPCATCARAATAPAAAPTVESTTPGEELSADVAEAAPTCLPGPTLPSPELVLSLAVRTPGAPEHCRSDAIDAGHFDLQTSSRSVTVAAVATCFDDVIKAAEDWASQEGFNVILEDRQEQYLLIHIAGAGGHFEIDYRVDAERGVARASMWHVDGDGTVVHASQVHDVEPVKQSIMRALRCE